MANALFAFDDPACAQRAAERAAARLPPQAVALHTKDPVRSASLLRKGGAVLSVEARSAEQARRSTARCKTPASSAAPTGVEPTRDA